MSPGGVARRTFLSIRTHRNYRLWFIGQVISMTGTWMQNVALGWFVVDQTRSGVAVGVLIACQFGPYAVFGLFGGSLADRFDNRRILLITQAAFAANAIALAVLALTGLLTVWEADMMAAIGGMVMVFDTPARQAFTVQMVGRRELPNAIALNSSLFNSSRAVGPAIGGVLLATTSVGVCFAVNAVSFAAVISGLLLMRTSEMFHTDHDQRRHSVMRSVAEGISYSWRTVDVRVVLGVFMIVATFSMNFQVLVPVLAKKTLHAGPDTYGWLSTAFGVGALVGALIAAGRGMPTWRLLLTSGVLFTATLLVIAPLESTIAVAVVMVANGFGFAVYTSVSNSMIQMAVPDRLRGRVLAIYAYFVFGTAPLGGLIAGVLAERSTALAYLVTGAAGLAAVLLGIGHRTRLRSRARGSSAPDGAVASATMVTD